MPEAKPAATAAPLKPKDRDALVQALRMGVVARTGLQHVQVGRQREVEQCIADMDRIADGGSAVRFVIGDYGSGKTFFLNLARGIAIQKKLVVLHADLSPDRRIHSTGGHARALYTELVGNMSTRTRPEGGALASVVERLLDGAPGGGTELAARLAPLREMAGGHGFAAAVTRYQEADAAGDDRLKAAALRWLRGDFQTRTEAREELGVRNVAAIGDADFYDSLKAMGCLCRLAGYDGMFVVLDEMVNLYKLVSAQARNLNYEQVLRMVNDAIQGTGTRLGFYFGGTPELLLDGRRGLHSYEALRSRLAENGFARGGLVDLSGPVLRLQPLTPEELWVLLSNLRTVFDAGSAKAPSVPDEALGAFMEHCAKKVGDAYFRTPRNTVKAFLDMLSVLEQNPGADWRSLVGSVDLQPDAPKAQADINDGGDDEPLAGFRV